MTVSANDLLMGGGVPAAKFEQPGTGVTGRILREPEARKQTDLTTGEILRWANGDPRMQIVVHLATDQRDPGDPSDDGTRAIYIKGNMLNAVRAAIRAAGAPGLAVGGTLTVTYTSDGEPSKKGFNPPKLYSATYAPPRAAAANDVLMGNGNGSPAPAAPAGPPAGVDPAVWNTLNADQKAAILAATGQQPPF
jgi:hypothetical protein